MPRRAIFSTLLLLCGALSGSAAILDPAARNIRFQPRASLKTQVLKPAQAGSAAKGRLTGFKILKITPIWQAPAAVKLGRTAVQQPADAVVPSVSVKAGGGS
jgi:hypothetical protein